MTPATAARANIDRALTDAGWIVQDCRVMNIMAGPGVAIREFPLKPGHDFADYLLYANGQVVGVVEAKREGTPLTGVELQTARYSDGLPDSIPAPVAISSYVVPSLLFGDMTLPREANNGSTPPLSDPPVASRP